jgi:hypothetical protein
MSAMIDPTGFWNIAILEHQTLVGDAIELKTKRRAFARRFVSMDARVKPGHDV